MTSGEIVAIPETLDGLRVDIATLKRHPANARQGNVALIKESLQAHGQYRPIVVNRRTNEVLAGNHTLDAARELGWRQVAATFVDVDDDTATRIMLIDNRANDVATYDDRALAELLQGLEDDYTATGFASADLEKLIAGFAVGDEREADTEPQLGAIEYRLMIRCRDEHEQAKWLEQLQSEGLEVQALAQ